MPNQIVMHFIKVIIIVSCVFVNELCAQPGFNRIYDHSAIGNKEFHKIFVDEDIIIALGHGYESGTPQGIIVAKLDTLGNLIKQRFIVDSLNDHLATDFLWGDIYKTSSGYYGFPAVALSRGGYLLLQVDTALKIQSIFEFQSPNDITLFDHSMISLEDNGFFIAGNIYRNNLRSDGFIRRIDKNGNLLWFKYYGDYNKDESFRDMVKVSDNRFVLCGSAGPDFNDSKTARAGLWVVDSNGTVLQTWVGPESPDLIVIIGLLPASDGGFVAHGRIYLGQGPWGSKVQVCLMKFSPDLELEWLKPVGPTTSNYNGFMDMIQTPDGHYLAAGERTAYSLSGGDWGGWLFKFTEQGDSLWARADNAPPGYKATGEFVYGGVGLLSSGNIVAGGRGDVDDNFVGWVVKVTADGCLDTVFCQTSGLGEVTGAAEGLQVYPNPANQEVFIRLPEDRNLKSVSLIRLADGREALTLTSVENSFLKINTSSLETGLYALICYLTDGKVLQAKLGILH